MTLRCSTGWGQPSPGTRRAEAWSSAPARSSVVSAISRCCAMPSSPHGEAHPSECTCTVCRGDRKSTRLNSSHGYISYAVFCLKKKKKKKEKQDGERSQMHYVNEMC